MTRPPTALRVTALDYDYPTRPSTLRDVSITARTGEVTIIVGASGSGKSTLLACLAGLLSPSGGGIDLDGRRLTRGDVAVITQGAPLFEKLAAWENVATAWGAPRATMRDPALEALTAFGVSDVGDSLPHALSFGQRQRVAIAGAVAGAAPIILADEPTGGLDPENAARVWMALRAAASTGRIVIAVTHDHASTAVAHHVIRLHEGTTS